MKTSELGGFAAMRRQSKEEVQIVSVSGEVDLYSAHRLGEVISGGLRGVRRTFIDHRAW